MNFIQNKPISHYNGTNYHYFRQIIDKYSKISQIAHKCYFHKYKLFMLKYEQFMLEQLQILKFFERYNPFQMKHIFMLQAPMLHDFFTNGTTFHTMLLLFSCDTHIMAHHCHKIPATYVLLAHQQLIFQAHQYVSMKFQSRHNVAHNFQAHKYVQL